MPILISHSHRFLFVHVYKVAGTSISKALEKYARQPNPFWLNTLFKTIRVPLRFPSYLRNELPPHASARQLQQALPPRIFDGFFKFAFVRNPWDWQVSYYHFVLGKPRHHQHQLFKSMLGFDDYVHWRAHQPKFCQVDFLTNERGQLLVDFIGRFETLSEDFRHVCDVLKIPAQLPHTNQSSRRDYRVYYNAETRRLIEQHFRQDVDFFGYTFDNQEVAQCRAA